MRHILAVTAAAAALGGPAGAQTPRIDMPWIERFEARLQLNDRQSQPYRRDLRPVADLVRFYRLDQTTTGPVVRALFLEPWPIIEAFPESPESPSLTRPGVHIDEPFPIIDDGGCGVITLTISYDSGEVTEAHCNGNA